MWAVKYRQPSLIAAVEQVLKPCIAKVVLASKCRLLACENALDHVHIAVEIPPAVAVAKLMTTLKGTTSYAINHAFSLEQRFQWQTGYGVLTFGPRATPIVVAYVESQKERHGANNLIMGMEQYGDE